MEVFQIRILHLNWCVILTLLTHADFSKSNEQKIQLHINKTAHVGDTVTFICNKTQRYKEYFTWKMNNSVVFSFDTYSNQTIRNFTSNRMYIDLNDFSMDLKIYPVQASDAGNYVCYISSTVIQWILTITEDRPESPKQIPLNIISSCTGIIMVCLIISFSIWIHRRWKKNEDTGHRETRQHLSQMPARGRTGTQAEYFERYNSIYGQVH